MILYENNNSIVIQTFRENSKKLRRRKIQLYSFMSSKIKWENKTNLILDIGILFKKKYGNKTIKYFFILFKIYLK
jgi:hypothetical protein